MKNPIVLSLIIAILSCFQLPLQGQKLDKDIFGLQEVLIKLEMDIADSRTRAITGSLDPEKFEFADESIPSNGMCLANALDLCKANLNDYYLAKGAVKSLEMTNDLFGGLMKKFKIGKLASLSKMLVEAKNEDEFMELLAKYVVEESISKGAGDVANVFKDKLNKDWTAPFIDKLTDEAKNQVKKAFNDNFYPESEQEVFKNTYDPGLSALERYNPLSDAKVCPVKSVGYHTQSNWFVDGENVVFPTLKIVFKGDCNCKYPKTAASNQKVNEFEIIIYVQAKYSKYVKSSFGLTGMKYDTLSRFQFKDSFYEVDLSCCNTENISSEPNQVAFTDKGGLLIGTNSGILFEHLDGENTLGINAGAVSQYFIKDKLSIGFDASYVLSPNNFIAANRYISNGVLLKPNINYYIPISMKGKIYFAPSFGLPVSIGKSKSLKSNNFPLPDLVEKGFGAEVSAGFAFELPQFLLAVQAPIFSYQHQIFTNKNAGTGFNRNKIGLGANNSLFNFSFLWKLTNKRSEETLN